MLRKEGTPCHLSRRQYRPASYSRRRPRKDLQHTLGLVPRPAKIMTPQRALIAPQKRSRRTAYGEQRNRYQQQQKCSGRQRGKAVSAVREARGRRAN
jgi:hypothetical protein